MKYLLLLTLATFSTNIFATELFSHDKNGVPISGSKQLLIDAALSGKTIAVKINVNGIAIYQGYITQVHDTNSDGVIDTNDDVCLMTRLYAANITSVSNFSAVHAPYSANFCTNGHEYVRHSNGNFFNNSFNMTWIQVD